MKSAAKEWTFAYSSPTLAQVFVGGAEERQALIF
jgi:hypothetical protein